MSNWRSDELAGIGDVDEVRVSFVRADGTRRPPVPIWVVRSDDAIYVRSYRGTGGKWYCHARADGSGLLQTATHEYQVAFKPANDEELQQRVDDAYRHKYSRFGGNYITQMISDAARDTTLRIEPASYLLRSKK
jgi:hypothetical protein